MHPHIILDTIIGISLMEVFVKPLTIRLTKIVLKRADKYVELIPDWLYTNSN